MLFIKRKVKKRYHQNMLLKFYYFDQVTLQGSKPAILVILRDKMQSSIVFVSIYQLVWGGGNKVFLTQQINHD